MEGMKNENGEISTSEAANMGRYLVSFGWTLP
jgi:hypothetical protein